MVEPAYVRTDIQSFIEKGELGAHSFDEKLEQILPHSEVKDVANEIFQNQKNWLNTHHCDTTNAPEWKEHFAAAQRSFKVLNLKQQEDDKKPKGFFAWLWSLIFDTTPKWKKEGREIFDRCFQVYLETTKSKLLGRFDEIIGLVEQDSALAKPWNAYKIALITDDPSVSKLWSDFIQAASFRKINQSDIVRYFEGRTTFDKILKEQFEASTLSPFGLALLERYDDLKKHAESDRACKEQLSKVHVAYLHGSEKGAKENLQQLLNTLKGAEKFKEFAENMETFVFAEAPKPSTLGERYRCNKEAIHRYSQVKEWLQEKNEGKEIITCMREEASSFVKKCKAKEAGCPHAALSKEIDMSSVILGNQSYIASAAPHSDKSAFHYFTALLKKNSSVIVDLKEDAEGEMKGFKLLPHKVGEIKEYVEGEDKIIVKLLSKVHTQIPHVKAGLHFLTRMEIEVDDNGEKRKIVVHQLRNWAAMTAPDPIALRALHTAVSKDCKEVSRLAVNCRDGLGRTETFILYHHLASRLNKENTLDVISLHYEYMKYRSGIPMPEQLACIFGALAEQVEEKKVADLGYQYNPQLYVHPAVNFEGDWQTHLAHTFCKYAKPLLASISVGQKEAHKYLSNLYVKKMEEFFAGVEESDLQPIAKRIHLLNKECYFFLSYLMENAISYADFVKKAEPLCGTMTPLQYLTTGDTEFFKEVYPDYATYDPYLERLKKQYNVTDKASIVKAVLEEIKTLKKNNQPAAVKDLRDWLKDFMLIWNKDLPRDTKELDFIQEDEWKLIPPDLIPELPINSAKVLQSLEPEQLRKLKETTYSPQGWKAITENGRVAALAPEVCEKIPESNADFVDILALSKEQLVKISPDILRKKNLTEIFSKLPTSHIHALTKDQLAVFFEKNKVFIDPVDMWKLSTDQIKNLKRKHFAKLNENQLASLAGEQRKALTGYMLSKLPNRKKTYFLNPTAISSLNLMAFAESPQLLLYLLPEALEKFVSSLQPADLWILRRDARIAAKMRQNKDFCDLLKSKFKINSLTQDQVLAMDEKALKKLPPAAFLLFNTATVQALPPEKVKALESNQIAVILRELTMDQIAVLEKGKLNTLPLHAQIHQNKKMQQFILPADLMNKEATEALTKQSEWRKANCFVEYSLQTDLQKSLHFKQEGDEDSCFEFVSGDLLSTSLTGLDSPELRMLAIEDKGGYLMVSAQSSKLSDHLKISRQTEQLKQHIAEMLDALPKDKTDEELGKHLKTQLLKIVDKEYAIQYAQKIEIKDKKYLITINNTTGAFYKFNSQGELKKIEAIDGLSIEEIQEDHPLFILSPGTEALLAKATEEQKAAVLLKAYTQELTDVANDILEIARDSNVFEDYSKLLEAKRLGIGFIDITSPTLKLDN